MKKTPLCVTQHIIHIRYHCPHCHEVVSYFEECHYCLRRLHFNVIYRSEHVEAEPRQHVYKTPQLSRWTFAFSRSSSCGEMF